jgi:hypothetical protein
MTHRQRIFGYEECEDAEGDAFFKSISEDLEAFAWEHHLTIWKYPYRAPMWMFHFLHPKGGFAFLQLYCASNAKKRELVRVSVYGDWYMDDHENRLRRHYPHGESVEVRPASEEIVRCLAKQLEAIVACPVAELVAAEYSYVPTGDGRGNDLVSEFELSLRVPK